MSQVKILFWSLLIVGFGGSALLAGGECQEPVECQGQEMQGDCHCREQRYYSQDYRYSPYYTYSPFKKHQTSPFKDYSTDYQDYYMYHNYNQGW